MIDWRHWHNEPYLVGGLVLLGWAWAILAGPLRRLLAPGAAYPRRQALWFYLGLLIFYLAVGSPFDQIGERFLFSAHMLQHQILAFLAPLLFVLGLPGWMIDSWLGRSGLLRFARLFTRPLLAGFIYIVVTSIWHMPYLYDWALQDKIVHVIEHIMFFAAAILLWWPVVSPSRLLPPASYAGQMIYAVYVVIGMTPVFAYIVFSQHILYPTYEFAPRLFPDFDAASDQLLAGVMMELLGVAVSLAIFATAFFRWYRVGEKRDAAEADAKRALLETT
ncbi:cytochrome c oxidase assembly protein [Horticoccus luteus]|uniref:Cytochrome c oxidase assembly protein n=1 Tax=Horticoccus luteus TaxID=2862869 RepID=A0A8F9TVE7_9BACT|nr:cytochrome c oxidase assembly protein [Horticoccus luteus]QYM79979.1 cytochrome c oxidase assembly protein [Horticoccus luteus]